MSPAAGSAAPPHLTAVIVAHNGAPWLGRLLAALRDSSRAPDRVVAVDTGSTDDSAALLRDELGSDAVVDAPVTSGFGAAVAAGLAAVPDPPEDADQWLWLLHDDCLPGPDTLHELLATAEADPDAGVVGCRIRAWPRGQRLLEIGVSIAGNGRRETGLEPGEYDQGQYDDVRQVLAVSSAGMLVRRDVWDRLSGFDPALPLFRDDVDFGWRAARAGVRVLYAPTAELFHAEAATRGARAIHNTAAHPHRADRRAALHTLLANCSLPALPLQYLRLLLGSLLRVIGFGFGKLPGAAYDEALAAASVLGRPWRLIPARKARRRTAVRRASHVRGLLPRWWTPYAHGLDTGLLRLARAAQGTTSVVSGSARRLRAGRGLGSELETGPVAEETVNLPTGSGPVEWARSHPLLSVVVVLTLCAAFASRGLWGSGFLQGGSLPPAPDGAGDWWHLYVATWHQVGVGTGRPAAPYVAMLALPATVLFGKAWLVVDLVMLFAAPLAAVGAYAASTRFIRSRVVRAWTAAIYGLLPVLTGAVPNGKVGTVAMVIALPWVARAFIPLLRRSSGRAWQSAWLVGLTLAVASAFAPVVWTLVAALTIIAALWYVVVGPRVRVLQLLWAVVLPAGLLLPWSRQMWQHPTRLLTEAGLVDPHLAGVGAAAWQVPLGRLGVDAAAPWWLTLGVALAALAALFRSDRRPAVTAAWITLALAMAAAAVLAGRTVPVPGTDATTTVWLGVPVVVGQAAAVAAAGLAADGMLTFVGAGAFGWRQPLAVFVVLLAGLAPVAGAAWWVAVAPHGQLERTHAVALPAYMIDAMHHDQRVLVIHGDQRPVTYQLLAGDGMRLGDDSVEPLEPTADVTATVTSLLTEATPQDVARLADAGVSAVVLTPGSRPAFAADLDAVGGLDRASASGGLRGWRVQDPAQVEPGSAASTGPHRMAWLVGQAALWAVTLVMAVPGIDRSRRRLLVEHRA